MSEQMRQIRNRLIQVNSQDMAKPTPEIVKAATEIASQVKRDS